MHPRSTFTRPDLIAILSIAAVAACLIVPALSRSRQAACQLTDADHLRLITQGMAIFALANEDQYPLPGDVDAGNTTVDGLPESKNVTGNLLSFLIYQGHIKPETCVSPAEANTGQVVACASYEYENPSSAVNPAEAMWDPGFAGTPFDSGRTLHTPGLSNQSYAPLVYFGQKRTERWRSRGDSPTALISNRGPMYVGTTYPAGGNWQLVQHAFGTGSWTLLFYGQPDSWAGYVAYDDGAALFHETPNPERTLYTRSGTAEPRQVADCLFVDETDDGSGSSAGSDISARLNLYMRPIGRIQSGASTVITIWID